MEYYSNTDRKLARAWFACFLAAAILGVALVAALDRTIDGLRARNTALVAELAQVRAALAALTVAADTARACEDNAHGLRETPPLSSDVRPAEAILGDSAPDAFANLTTECLVNGCSEHN